MTVTVKCLLEAKDAESAQTTQYTSPANGKGTIIDKFTATNYDAAAQTLSVNVVPNGGAAGNSNLTVKTRSLAAGECYVFPELVGHVLNPGDFLSTLASAANKVNIRASGREIT